MKKKMKTFKGFNADMTCRDFQYKEGEEYKSDGAIRCAGSGFHSCENPLDVFGYYPPSNSVFAECEASGEIDTDDDDTKIASSIIKIKANISLHAMIDAGVEFIFSKAKKINKKYNSGDSGAASNSGDSGAASNSGDSGAASNSGYSGAASNSGDRGAASNSGDSGAASNSGDSGAASNSGDRGAASNSGYSGAASNSGYSGAASNSGYSGAAFSTGLYSSSETNAEKSVACSLGYDSKVKGNLGSWIIVAERDNEENILGIKSVKVDGKKVKADTWYKLIKGKLTKC